MRKMLIVCIGLLISILVLNGCSSPQGGFGPSWDVTAKIPLIKGSEETSLSVEELLSTELGLELNTSEESGELLSLQNTINEADLSDFDFNIGNQIHDFEVPGDFSQSIVLGSIKVDGLVSEYNETVDLTGGQDITQPSFAMIDMGVSFDSLTFDNNTQPANIIIDNSQSDVDITYLALTFTDSKGNEYYTTEFTDDILAGEVGEDQWPLAGLQLVDDVVNVNLEVSTAGDVGDTGTVNVDIDFPGTIKASSIQGLDSSTQDSIAIDKTLTIDNLNWEAGLNKVGFIDGHLAISMGEIPGFDVSVDSIGFANLSDVNNDGQISLIGQEIDFTSDNFNEVSISATLTDKDGVIDYTAGQTVDVNANFADVLFEYVDMNLDESDIAMASLATDLSLKTEVSFLEELRTELNKIDLRPDLMLHFKGLQGATLDLSQMWVRGLDSQGNVALKDGKPMEFNFGKLTGETPVINLTSVDPNIVDIIKSNEVEKLVFEGSYKVEGENVRINYDSILGMKQIDIDIPFQAYLNEEFVYELAPTKLPPVKNDAIDIIKNGISEARFIIDSLNNNTSVGFGVKVYTQEIKDSNLSETELNSLVYQEENIMLEANINSRSSEDLEVVLKAEDAEILEKDNVYIGLKLILPESDDEPYQILSGDSISFDSIYITVTGLIGTNR